MENIEFELGTTIALQDENGNALAELPLKYVKGQGITGVQEGISAKIYLGNIAGWLRGQDNFIGLLPDSAKKQIENALDELKTDAKIIESRDLSFAGGTINFGLNLEDVTLSGTDLDLPAIGGLTPAIKGIYVKLKAKIGNQGTSEAKGSKS